MKTLKFSSLDQVNNIGGQLPPGTRHSEGELMARQQPDGTYELIVSDDLFAVVKDLDPLKPATGDLLGLADSLRDESLIAGIDFQGNRFQTRPKDRDNIAEVTQVASLAVLRDGAQAGNLRWHGGSEDFAWIDQDNSLVPMDAPTMIDFGRAVAARHSGIMVATRQVKDQIEAGDLSSDAAVRTALADASVLPPE